MNAEAEPQRTEATVEPPGSRLKAAREAAGLGQEEVAAELRLGAGVIDALEHDAVERLPAPIFVRGYLRNYAVLLGLPPQEVVDAYNQSVGRGQAQGLMAGPMQQQLVGARRRNYLVWLLVLGIAVAAGWWFQQRNAHEESAQPNSSLSESPTGEPGAEPMSQAAESETPSPTETQGHGEADMATPQPLPPQAEPVTPPPEDVVPPADAAAPEPEAIASAPAQPEAAAPSPAAADTLTLNFSASSWVEVHDATGQRLLYRLASAGESHALHGQAPFRLVLGNAPGARVEINGTAVDVAAHTKGKTARFSVAP